MLYVRLEAHAGLVGFAAVDANGIGVIVLVVPNVKFSILDHRTSSIKKSILLPSNKISFLLA